LAHLEGLGFAVDWFDRGSYRREDPIEVARLRALNDARVLLIARDMPVLRNSEKGLDSLLPMSEIGSLGGAEVEALLGLAPDGAPIFGALLADAAVEQRSDFSDGFLDRRILVVPGREDLKLIDLRSIAVSGLVPPDQGAMLAAAKALMHWHAHHRFCANCGALTDVAIAGWRRDCQVCKATHFPRTDPVVIMLAIDGDACVLGRQPRFPKGM
jgi:NAD+ diphosphatase